MAGATIAGVLPWFMWTALFKHTSSSMTLYFFGWGIPEGSTVQRELPHAWHHFLSRFPGGVLHDRWVSLRESSGSGLIVDVIRRRLPDANVFAFYDRTVPGMTGLAMLPPLAAGFVQSARRRVGVGTAFVVTSVVLLAMWGMPPHALGASVLQPVVPFLAIAVAIGVAEHRWLRPLLFLGAFEIWTVVRTNLLTGYPGHTSQLISVLYLALLMVGAALASHFAGRASHDRALADRPVGDRPSSSRSSAELSL
jgi:hypothetical protein